MVRDKVCIEETIRYRLGFLILFTFIWALLFTGCQYQKPSSSTPTPIIPRLDSKSPHIRGLIRDIFRNQGKITGVFIEGNKEPDTEYDKAVVGITEKTVIYSKVSSKYQILTPEDMFIGENVSVLFVGPIGASYPVQAYADEIIVSP